MTDARTATSRVEVPVDPATAFTVFTDEMDLWHVHGPINHHDSARIVELRCEPGVGGRVVEIYDEATGDGLERGRITAWEPGARLAWDSSIDDTTVEVTFTPTGAGTEVRVLVSVPPGGQDLGGTSWARTLPWLSAWVAKRDREPHRAEPIDRLLVAVSYAKPATAARWLTEAFGFRTNLPPLPEDDSADSWTEFRVGHCAVVVLKLGDDRAPAPAGGGPVVPWIFVDDLDEHLATARAAGAAIVEDVHQHGYRAYTAADPEGNRWTFAQASPVMRRRS